MGLVSSFIDMLHNRSLWGKSFCIYKGAFKQKAFIYFFSYLTTWLFVQSVFIHPKQPMYQLYRRHTCNDPVFVFSSASDWTYNSPETPVLSVSSLWSHSLSLWSLYIYDADSQNDGIFLQKIKHFKRIAWLDLTTQSIHSLVLPNLKTKFHPLLTVSSPG